MFVIATSMRSAFFALAALGGLAAGCAGHHAASSGTASVTIPASSVTTATSQSIASRPHSDAQAASSKTPAGGGSCDGAACSPPSRSPAPGKTLVDYSQSYATRERLHEVAATSLENWWMKGSMLDDRSNVTSVYLAQADISKPPKIDKGASAIVIGSAADDPTKMREEQLIAAGAKILVSSLGSRRYVVGVGQPIAVRGQPGTLVRNTMVDGKTQECLLFWDDPYGSNYVTRTIEAPIALCDGDAIVSYANSLATVN